MKRTLIHLGCGPLAKRTQWEDFDGSWNLRLRDYPTLVRKPILALMGSKASAYRWPEHVRYLNLTNRFPFESDSVDAIYASHVWEHLYSDEANFATSECFRTLKKGGILRLVVPNLRYLVQQYVADGDADAALRLNQGLLLRGGSRPHSWLMRAYEALADFHNHKFMYDPPYLTQVLTNAGFAEVKEMKCHESRIQEITDVESPGRVSESAGFAIEGVKPFGKPES